MAFRGAIHIGFIYNTSRFGLPGRGGGGIFGQQPAKDSGVGGEKSSPGRRVWEKGGEEDREAPGRLAGMGSAGWLECFRGEFPNKKEGEKGAPTQQGRGAREGYPGGEKQP